MLEEFFEPLKDEYEFLPFTIRQELLAALEEVRIQGLFGLKTLDGPTLFEVQKAIFPVVNNIYRRNHEVTDRLDLLEDLISNLPIDIADLLQHYEDD